MADRADTAESVDGAPDLRAFVPRGSLQWLLERPDLRHRRVEASLVFVDISGFTAMSERLARLGRVGAEEVTDLLNQTFSRLLAVAYEDDGSLLKFGGDALLLQFEGDDHAGRAVNAAWGMRRKLRELQPLKSSAGQVRLRMSVGVHTGEIDQFLVGSDHRELLLAGPGATEVVRMEGAAGAGQIMVSPAVVDALGRRISVTPSTPGSLLRSAPTVPRLPAKSLAKEVPAELAHHLLPAQVRQRLEAGVPGSEHRPSVVGFVKFTGVEDHLAARGAEATALALEHLVDSVVDACREHDVCLLSTDVDADGGKFILTAGVPTSLEFNGERMLRALQKVLAAEHRFGLKIGVHHGPVFAGVVGPWFRLTYTIIGDAVNLAARVMGHAKAGEILATAEVLNRSQALFQLDELPPFAVKGKKHPVTAFRVGELTSARLRRARARFRLAGRQEELATLVELIDATAEGQGRLVQLTGPAGIGKSRLVDELHERRPDSHLLMVGCSQHESATPYHAMGLLLRVALELSGQPTVAELREAVAGRAPELLDVLPLLGDVIGIDVPDNEHTADLSAGFRSERAVAAVRALLEAAVPEPAIIVVEDLHWVDPETRTALLAVARTVLPRRRWLLVLTSRHRVVLDAKDHPEEVVVELRPLTDADAREFVYAAAEEGLVTLERGQQLLARADGNPFFLQELLRCDGEQGDGELPDSVDDLVQSQLDQLPPEDRELLGYAAVLGADIDPPLLEAMAGIAVDAQRRAFGRLGSFIEKTATGGFRFRHALMQDGAYQRLPFKQRRELHLAAAAVLEARGGTSRPDLLALHTYHARDWERARGYALAAAVQASERFANLTAAEQYRHAIESGRQVRGLADDDAAADWEHLGDTLMLACSYDEAVAAYRRACRLAGPTRQVHLFGQIGQVRERQGRYPEALRWFTRAITLDASAGTGEAGRMLVEAGIVRSRQGRPADAVALADRAEATGSADVQIRARIHYVRAWAAMLRGDDAAPEGRRSLELFEAAGDLIGQCLAHSSLSMNAYFRGNWDEAAEAYEQTASFKRRIGDEVGTATATGNLGELLSDQGHFDRARPLLEECRTVCAAAGFQSSRLFATMTLGRLDARMGRYEDAALQLKEALDGLESLGLGPLAADCQRFRAELSVFTSDHHAALERAERLDALALTGTASLRAAGERIRTAVHLDRGDVPAAVDAADRLLGMLDPEAHDYETALCLVAAAAALEAGGVAAASGVRTRAARILRGLGVVVPGELLVFGPSSSRAERS